MGPVQEAFEKALAARVGAPHAIAVSSGTAGLHLSLLALGVRPGDEVITTPLSFVASANAILHAGATPVFVDVEAESLNIDPSRIEHAITLRTRAILAVHLFGRPADMMAITAIAARHRLLVIEDACEALDARTEGRAAGTFGDTGVYAFYANKQITTAEGGMIVTGDPEVGRHLRAMRNQGRHGHEWLDHHLLGYNYRLSELHCALGLSQLGRLDVLNRAREQAARRYRDRLSACSELTLPAPAAPGMEPSWFVFVVRLPRRLARDGRDRLVDLLAAEGIECGRYFPLIPLQPYYRHRFGDCLGEFPVAGAQAERAIALPFFPGIEPRDIDRVCDALIAALDQL